MHIPLCPSAVQELERRKGRPRLRSPRHTRRKVPLIRESPNQRSRSLRLRCGAEPGGGGGGRPCAGIRFVASDAVPPIPFPLVVSGLCLSRCPVRSLLPLPKFVAVPDDAVAARVQRQLRGEHAAGEHPAGVQRGAVRQRQRRAHRARGAQPVARARRRPGVPLSLLLFLCCSLRPLPVIGLRSAAHIPCLQCPLCCTQVHSLYHCAPPPPLLPLPPPLPWRAQWFSDGVPACHASRTSRLGAHSGGHGVHQNEAVANARKPRVATGAKVMQLIPRGLCTAIAPTPALRLLNWPAAQTREGGRGGGERREGVMDAARRGRPGQSTAPEFRGNLLRANGQILRQRRWSSQRRRGPIKLNRGTH